MTDLKDCQLVLLRHGESEWNKLNLFTGWRDVRLTSQGEAEAREGGRLMGEGGFKPDVAYTSLQSRAIKTLWLALEAMDRMWIPVVKNWHLNERHYGRLQGQNKAEAVQEFGEDQVLEWRRSFATPPPPLSVESPDHPARDPRYAGIDAKLLPVGESLKMVLARVMPYWESAIAPDLKSGKRVLVAAHGNSLRALLKHLEGVSDDEIVGINIPTGVPKAYRLNASLLSDDTFYLGDQEELAKKIAAVKNQTKKA
ncbi:MAG: 2,3-diphosphoglycerate-dependent phosphoglycerate mutase [Alphaproteobacteria bacterium]|nr:2,3-diphosphoglycerate-dependent phosphoglycerate mutase [Alphaproteobacteria bacterium]